MKKVDFFIAGNSKSGTTAIYEFLKQHPSVCVPPYNKEPNYFATDFLHDVDVGIFRRRTERQYHGLFSACPEDTLWGEASGSYLYSKEAAQRIYAYNPDAKIITIFREPVDFLHSYHLQMLKNPISEGETIKDFEEALRQEPLRKQGKNIPEGCLIPALLYYAERVKYAEHLGRFLSRFDASNIKVIIYEDFKADNDQTFKEILSFLGIDEEFEVKFDKYNRGKKIRSRTLKNIIDTLVMGHGVFRYAKSAVKKTTPRSVRRLLFKIMYNKVAFKPKPDVDPELRHRLKKRFKPEVEKFSQLVNQDLVAKWGYDAV